MTLNDILEKVGDRGLLSAVLDTTESAIAITDARGSIVGINHAFRELFGFADREVVGRPIWAFRCVDNVAQARHSFRHREVDTDGSFRTNEERWRTSDGQELFLRWSVKLLRDEDDEELLEAKNYYMILEVTTSQLMS